MAATLTRVRKGFNAATISKEEAPYNVFIKVGILPYLMKILKNMKSLISNQTLLIDTTDLLSNLIIDP